jgi:hypothetical protein
MTQACHEILEGLMGLRGVVTAPRQTLAGVQ